MLITSVDHCWILNAAHSCTCCDRFKQVSNAINPATGTPVTLPPVNFTANGGGLTEFSSNSGKGTCCNCLRAHPLAPATDCYALLTPFPDPTYAVPGLNYNGGPVVPNTPKIYFIWYGTWTSAQQAIVRNLLNGLSGSQIESVLSGYSDNKGHTAATQLTLGSEYSPGYPYGKALSDSNIFNLAFNNGHLPVDPNGIYAVLTSPDVTETSGFCTQCTLCSAVLMLCDCELSTWLSGC